MDTEQIVTMTTAATGILIVLVSIFTAANSASKSGFDQLKDVVKTLQEQVDKLEKSIERKEQEIDMLRKRVDALENENRMLKEENERLKTRPTNGRGFAQR
jgi:chromosome segregation ATPase